MPDYIAFIEALDAKHELHRAEIVSNFPFFKSVVCDKHKANAVTSDFQGYLREQFGQ